MVNNSKEFRNEKILVLLHAFPLSSSMWKVNVNKIKEAGFRIITPDLLGFGKNVYSSETTSMEDMANDVAEYLDSLNIEKAIIGGLSMGGYVTFNLYRLFPNKFSAIILCDTNCEDEPEEKQQLRYDLVSTVEEQGSQALIEHILPNLICENTKENNKELVAYLEKEFLNAKPEAVNSALRGMAVRKDHTYLLSKMDIPALLVFGENDKITNLETAQKMKNLIPNAQLKIIPNAGHYSNLENSESFNSILISFLQKL